MAPPSIFISSTFSDLERHRQLVREAISNLKFRPNAMELFGAQPETPKEECLRLVRTASVYVGIFAMRYGSIDLASGKSMTQIEYEEAQAIRIPSLIYVIDEENHPVLPKHVDVGSSAEKLGDLKTVLKNCHVVNFFSSPEDLVVKVTQDVARLIGSIAKQPTAQVLSQLAANAIRRHPLTPPRFEYLKNRTAGVFKQDVPVPILREALELIISGDRMAAAFIISRGTPMLLDDAIDGLMAIDKILIDIVVQN